MDHEIGEREIGPVLALTHRALVTMETIADGIGDAFRVLVEHAATHGVRWAGPPFVLYPEECEGEFEIAVCMPVAEGAVGGEAAAVEDIAGGLCVSTVHAGPYTGIGEAYAALQRWMDAHGRRPAGPVREVYLNDPDAVPPEELLTEIDWPVV